MVRFMTASIAFIGLLLFLSPTLPVGAQAVTAEDNCEDATSATFLGLPTWYRYLEPKFEDGECKVGAIMDGDDIDIGATAGAILLAVTEVLLRIAGIVAVGFIVYGGILYTISQGEPERLGSARKTIINGILGLVIAVFAVAIVNLLTNVLLP